MMIPQITFGAGAPLLFLHANGYPPGCYAPLLERLGEDFRVHAMLQRPLWNGERPESLQDWGPLSLDILEFIRQTPDLDGPLAVAGHSMGGIAALRAAVLKPQLFRRLVLIDPVLFQPHFILGWNFLRAIGLGDRTHPLIPAARRRRRRFDDLDRLFTAYRRRSIFRYMDDESLRAYITGIVQPLAPGQADGSSYELAYSPDWETRIYLTGVWRDLELWRALPHLKVPTLIIRGEETDTFLKETARRVERVNPAIHVVTLPHTTHLVPLEKPDRTHQLIRDFVQQD